MLRSFIKRLLASLYPDEPDSAKKVHMVIIDAALAILAVILLMIDSMMGI